MLRQRVSSGAASATCPGAASTTVLLPPRTSRQHAAVCRAQGGRSPRSTVSEASNKQQQQQPKRPSALSQTSQPRPISPEQLQQHNNQQQPSQSQHHDNSPQQQQPSKSGGGKQQGQAWWRERRRQAQRAAGMTKLEEVMRDTPGLNRLVDGTLILGDAVMVLATEVRARGVCWGCGGLGVCGDVNAMRFLYCLAAARPSCSTPPSPLPHPRTHTPAHAHCTKPPSTAQAASERVPVNEVPYLAAVAVVSWVFAGAVLGDYKGEQDPDANPLR